MKDITVDRLAPRQRLLAALDEVISEKLDPAHHIDAVERQIIWYWCGELHGWLQ
ncbi:L-rhamnose isomerase [Escherichia coli]|uniref:L-rhamnose isomerase n=1 Tax=Escherichia coli TaxID=562 RepID=A0A376MMJ8_ECOLX|nr:L-rhamnose isomerase [Escherichia coli]